MLITFKEAQKAEESKKEYKEGRYDVRITNASEGKSKNTGTPYLEVEFETIGEVVFKIKNRFYQTEKALNILLNFLSVIGYYDKNKQENINFDPQDLIGSMLSVEFKKGEKKDDGKTYMEYVNYSAEAIKGLATSKKEETDNEIIDEEEIPFN